MGIAVPHLARAAVIAKTIALLLSELRRCADSTLAASAGPMIQHSKQAAHLGEVRGVWQRALTGDSATAGGARQLFWRRVCLQGQGA